VSLLESLSGLANRHLKQEQFAVLRTGYFAARAKLRPLTRAIYGSFDAPALREHLNATIGRDFDILMVHSSVNRMAPTYTGTALELVKMLIDWCMPDKTLAMPAFYFGDPEIDAATRFRQNPRFDLRRVPSQMGLASELFRRTKGVVQSRHPVYRVSALGPLAALLVEGHESAPTYCGRGTPFDVMAERNTMILGLGKSFEVLTQVHHAEDVMGDQFPEPRNRGEPLSMLLIEGTKEIPFRGNTGSVNARRNMWKLREIMTPQTLREWRFHNVPMFATRAADVTVSLINAAKHGKTIYERL
jgi:aminoglycoside 3-N-acetyltransferase